MKLNVMWSCWALRVATSYNCSGVYWCGNRREALYPEGGLPENGSAGNRIVRCRQSGAHAYEIVYSVSYSSFRKKKSSNSHSLPKHETEICVSSLSSYRTAKNVVIR